MTDLTNTPAEEKEDDRNLINIPEWNLDKFEKELGKLNKKARKCNCPELGFEILRTYTITDPRLKDDPDGMRDMYNLPTPKITMIEIEIKGEGPKIVGWKFLGTFDHNTLPGSVIVNTVPGETIPTKFHNCEPICEHCNKKRIRNETFLLQEEDSGEYKLIGRQCVRDYIGYDARTIFQFLAAIRKFRDSFDEDEEGWGGGGGRWADMFDLDQVLRTTAAIIHKEGWVSKSKADFDQIPTSGKVVSTFYSPIGTREKELWKEWVESLDLSNEKWDETAKEARAWLKEQPDNNEYMHNLHTIDQNPLGEIPTRLFGYWCSLVSSYQRAMDKLNEEAKWPKKNEHVGEPKERREFKVKLYKLRTFEGYHGYVHLHTFLDADGHTLTWFASREQKFEIGNEYSIVGTIKKHDDYNGWAQTVITRVKEA